MPFVQALKGTVSLNGNLFQVLSGTFKMSTTLEDITYTKSGGATYAIKLPGHVSGSGSINFVYDTSNQPTIAPYDLRPGSTTPITAIFTPDGTKPFSCSIFPSDLEFTTGPQAGPACKCSMSFESTDTITVPTS